jgi:hypothetical protein
MEQRPGSGYDNSLFRTNFCSDLVARSRQANVIDCGSTAYSIFLPEERPNTYRY